MWKTIAGYIWKLLPIALTVVALVLSVIGLQLSFQTSESLNQLTSNIQKFGNTVGELGNTVRSLNSSVQDTVNQVQSLRTKVDDLSVRLERVETTTRWNYVYWNLASINWQDYVKRMQELARAHDPPYVEPLMDGTYKVTESGKELVSPYMNQIIQKVKENSEVDEYKVVIDFGIDKLDIYSREKGINLELIIGIISSYVQEKKHEVR